MTADDAAEWSEAIGQVNTGGWRQVVLAVKMGVPQELGLEPAEWAAKYMPELGRVPRKELPEAAKELTDAGLTQREAGAVLGVGQRTIGRAIQPDDESEPNDSDPELGYAFPLLDDVPLWPDDGSESNDSDSEPEPEPESKPTSPAARRSDNGDEWYTPKWLFDALGLSFSIDVCSPVDRTHSAVPAAQYLTLEDDGLAQSWIGTVWCNPPYSQTDPWARRMIHHGNGLILCHIPMNAAWCTELWEACDGIRLFQAMEFVRPDGSLQRPAWWLQLAAFGPAATGALERLQPLGDAAYNKRRVASPMWRRA